MASMTPRLLQSLTALLLCVLCDSVVQVHAETTTWTLGTTEGRQHLVTPDGKPFLILGLSHASGAWQGKPGQARQQALEHLRADLRELNQDYAME